MSGYGDEVTWHDIEMQVYDPVTEETVDAVVEVQVVVEPRTQWGPGYERMTVYRVINAETKEEMSPLSPSEVAEAWRKIQQDEDEHVARCDAWLDEHRTTRGE